MSSEFESDTPVKYKMKLVPGHSPPEPQGVKLTDIKKGNLKKLLEIEMSKTIQGATRAEGIVARLVTMAIQGNLRAIELIMAYMYGKPQAQVQETDIKPFVLELTEGQKENPVETNGEANSGV
ncbi:MAG: hypothetical protein EBR82_82035 [Caulobacteraceae bacterium]|nr:hypothetical protein [Caulobacteraceae bacterium]